MTDALKARDAKDVEDAVRWALAEGKTLEVAGRGTKRALGRPSQSDLTLDLSGLSGVTLYEPEELVLSARAGTPLAEIEALVEQQAASSSPSSRWTTARSSAARPDAGSLGGALAANLSGPRRIKAGAARDHFLGFSAVSGRAETFKSGGRVVKNVTGYDLCKLLAGSFGTLAAMTEVTIKMLPAPETEATVLVLGLDDARANAAMSAAMASSCDVSAAAHLPRNVVMHFAGLYVLQARDRVPPRRLRAVGQAPQGCADRAAAAVRRSVEVRRRRRIRATLWRSVRDAAPFWASGSWGDWPLWRVSTTPARGAEFAAKLPPGAQLFYDWAGGLIWIALPPSAQRRRRHRSAAPRQRPAATPRSSAPPPRPAPRSTCSSRSRARSPASASASRRASIPRACSTPAACGRGCDADQLLPRPSSPIRTSRRPTRSCAPACIAASARRPARPMCCSATSSIRRAGAST